MKARKNDILLILALLVLAGGVWLYARLTREAGGLAVVTVDGTEAAVLPLDADREWTWTGDGGSNTIIIENGAVRVAEADCPDRLCVRQGAIRYSGETIVCLPHRLTVTVTGGASGEADAVAR